MRAFKEEVEQAVHKWQRILRFKHNDAACRYIPYLYHKNI